MIDQNETFFLLSTSPGAQHHLSHLLLDADDADAALQRRGVKLLRRAARSGFAVAQWLGSAER